MKNLSAVLFIYQAKITTIVFSVNIDTMDHLAVGIHCQQT